MPSMPHSLLLALLLLAGFAHIFALAAPVHKVASLLPDSGNGSLPTHHHQFPPLVLQNDTTNTTLPSLLPDSGNGSTTTLPTHRHQPWPILLRVENVKGDNASVVNGENETSHQFPPYLAPTSDGPRLGNGTSQSLPTHHHQRPPRLPRAENETQHLHWPGPILPRAENGTLNTTTLPTHHHQLPINETTNTTHRRQLLPLLFGFLKAENETTNTTTLPTHHHQLPPTTTTNTTYRRQLLPLLLGGVLKAENDTTNTTTLPTHHHQLPPTTTTNTTYRRQLLPLLLGGVLKAENETTNTTLPKFPPYVIRVGKEENDMPPAHHRLPPILPRAGGEAAPEAWFWSMGLVLRGRGRRGWCWWGRWGRRGEGWGGGLRVRPRAESGVT